MAYRTHSPLDPLPLDTPECDIHALPKILPHFFTPHLTDKPQNPIMDALNLSIQNNKESIRYSEIPKELGIIAAEFRDAPRRPQPNALWYEMVHRKVVAQVRVSLSCLYTECDSSTVGEFLESSPFLGRVTPVAILQGLLFCFLVRARRFGVCCSSIPVSRGASILFCSNRDTWSCQCASSPS